MISDEIRREPLMSLITYFLSHPRAGNVQQNLEDAHNIAQSLDYLNVIEPFKKVPQDGSMSEQAAMKECIKLLLEADAIILSGDYEHSRGCMLEWEVAKQTGKLIFKYQNGWLKQVKNEQTEINNKDGRL